VQTGFRGFRVKLEAVEDGYADIDTGGSIPLRCEVSAGPDRSDAHDTQPRNGREKQFMLRAAEAHIGLMIQL
jgi:hypothetical protein